MASDPPLTGGLGVLADLIGLHPAGPEGRLGLVGDPTHPRFLVPLGHPAATRAALLAYNRLRPLRTRLVRSAVAAGSRAGLDRLVLTHHFDLDTGPDSFVQHLAGLLDTPDLQVAVGVGNVDHVWKPTLQCFTPAGEAVAYVKVGTGPVGAHLVAHERPVLEAWAAADDPRLVVPRVLAATDWHGAPVICCEPMPADARRLPPGSVSAWPVRQLDPPEPDRPVAGAAWWTDRADRDADHPDVGPLLAAVADRHDGPLRPWARWHGDWVPWNLARSRRGLVAWDWEYSEPGAPVGLDEVHGAYQEARFEHGRPVPDALAAARHTAHHLVPRLVHRTAGDPSDAGGADTDSSAGWLADAHLVALTTRHTLLARLVGEPVGDHHDLMAAARARTAALTPRNR